MSAIKNFFMKKKTDAKFKLAGQGQKLGDADQARAQAAARAAAAASTSGGDRKDSRKDLTAQQRNAAQAALARMDQKKDDNDFEKKRSMAAIKAQARKEIEREKQVEAECQKLRETYGEKPVVELESPPGCTGVFFHCPLIGTDEVLPKDEMKKRIKEFLYAQAQEEPGQTSCLIIHTFTMDQEKVKVCIDTLCRYLDNIMQNPSEEKFRKIRTGNKAYQERVASVEGTDMFLKAVGFESLTIDGEEYLVYPQEKLETDFDTLQSLREDLVNAEPIRAELDRNVKVLFPNQAKRRFDLPPEFFNLTASEVKKEQQTKTEMAERESMFRTKAMREKEEQREKRKYRYTLIRIRFPDGLVLQGTFSVHEKFHCVLDFTSSHLEHALPFVLFEACAGGSRLDGAGETSLLDLHLVPTAVLNFSWHPDMADEIQGQMGENQVFLKPEVAALATPDD